MKDINSRLKCINELEELNIQNEFNEGTKLLELFSTYVYLTNPDYKYNETYLKDMIAEFWTNIEKYHSKVKFRDKIFHSVNGLLTPNKSNCQFIIQIDETWELRMDSTTEKKSSEWIRVVSPIPHLNSVSNDKTYIKFQFDNLQGNIFSEYRVINNKDSEKEDELIRFINKAIIDFIET